MAPRSATSERRREGGAIYLLLLFFVALTGAALASVGQSWSLDARRDRETELLWAGAAYRRAIASYYEMTPGPLKTYPAEIGHLLLDPRFPDRRRHLRQTIPDPLTGSEDWILLRAPTGGIIGIASRSEVLPLKRAGFEGANRVFDEVAARLGDRMRYRDWEFVFVPGRAVD